MKKPNNYYCHRTCSQSIKLPEGYQLIDKIGQGAFGQVYKIFNAKTSSIEVIKLTKEEYLATMSKENQIMSTLQSSEGFAKIKQSSSGKEGLVMTLLGESLEDTVQRAQINVVDMKRIAYQCVLRLKQLHEKGYVHRDLKPQNILFGNQNNPHKLYIVDYGLANTYKKASKLARKIYNGQLGTIKFCPLASHNCLQQFPKDDLQSLGYLLVYLMFNELPWSTFPKGLTQQEKFDQIKNLKKELDLERLCQGVNCLKKYFKIVRQLTVGQQIQYGKLLQLFQVPCKEEYCFSFCKENCFAKNKKGFTQGNKENQVEEQRVAIKEKILSGKLSPHEKRKL